MYTIKETNFKEIDIYKKDYYKNLLAPMDDMWEEGILPNCTYFLIKSENSDGFFAIDEENVLVSFYSNNIYDDLFIYILKKMNINKAYVSSYDPIFYNQCIKNKKSISINTMLFHETDLLLNTLAHNNINYKLANNDDFDHTVDYYFNKIGESDDWLKPYLTKLIKNKGLYLFKINEQIVGTGEVRKSISSKNYVNIGMTVSKDFRKRGIATYIIATIKQIYNKKNLKTICSTTIDNIGSQKTLVKCGYENYHNIYNVYF